MHGDSTRCRASFRAAPQRHWHTACFLVSDYFLEDAMLWTVFLVLVVLWMLGVVSSYTLGGFIHVLLVLAIVALLVQLIQGRRVV